MEIHGISNTDKGIKITYTDKGEEKMLASPELARTEFYDAANAVAREALLKPAFGALNNRDIKEPEELQHIIMAQVEHLDFTMKKNMGIVFTIRMYLHIEGGEPLQLKLAKIIYDPFDEKDKLSAAVGAYVEEAQRYIGGERAQGALFEQEENGTWTAKQLGVPETKILEVAHG